MKKVHSNIPFGFNAINPTKLTVSNFGSKINSKSETQTYTYRIPYVISVYFHQSIGRYDCR